MTKATEGEIDFEQRLESNPLVCHGAPVIKGTRVMVATVLGALAAGESYERVCENYPPVTVDDIRSCLALAARLAYYEVYELPVTT